MENLVIGVIKDYDFTHVEPWVNSLRMTGYKGDVLVIDASEQENVKLNETLTLLGVHYISMKASGSANFMVKRFILLYYVLSLEPFRKAKNLCVTDVRDVIFQADPTNFMRTRGINVETEGLTYECEPWSRANFQEVLGEIPWNKHRNRWIKCAGVIGGQTEILKDLFFTIYTMSLGLQQYPKGGGGPDQSVMNMILGMDVWMDKTNFLQGDVLHAGTCLDAVLSGSGEIGHQYLNSFDKNKFIEDFKRDSGQYPAKLIDGKIINTQTNKPFTIVHQYDRVNEWRDIHKQYRNKLNVST